MTFQLPALEVIENILANQQPKTPLNLTEVTDHNGNLLDRTDAELQLNQILGESGPLPAITFPLMEELVSGVEALENSRINTVVKDGIVAGQMLEIRLYGASSLDRYQAVADLKEQLEPWMSVLSHPIFQLGKASLSDRLDKELKGKEGRAKGGVYLQLSWSFDFVAHSELYEYQLKKEKASAETETSAQQTQTSGRQF